jgi:hypothetical protein
VATDELYDLCDKVCWSDLDAGEHILQTDNQVWNGKSYYTLLAGTIVVISEH